MSKVGRNDPCPCGSNKKYKKCCLPRDEAAANAPDPEVMAHEPRLREFMTPLLEGVKHPSARDREEAVRLAMLCEDLANEKDDLAREKKLLEAASVASEQFPDSEGAVVALLRKMIERYRELFPADRVNPPG